MVQSYVDTQSNDETDCDGFFYFLVIIPVTGYSVDPF